jgi:quercetin dioxygenase-like cupin family protein
MSPICRTVVEEGADLVTKAALAFLIGLVSAQPAPAPGPISRTDLQRHDLSVAGREAIQVRVDFAPGAIAPRHRHPGEEIVYVLGGTIEYRLDGRPAVTLRAGEVLFIPAGTVHAATNVGAGPASELATYIVETGKPLVEPVQ